MADLNLPGIRTNLKETNFALNVASVPPSDNIVFLGAAGDGPLFQAINVTRPSETYLTLGDYKTDSINNRYLMAAVNEAYNMGARNVTVMRICGLSASADLGQIILTGTYPGEKYNKVQYSVENGVAAAAASLTLVNEEVVPENVLTLTALEAGAAGNDLAVVCDGTDLEIAGINFSLANYVDVTALVDAINDLQSVTGVSAAVEIGHGADSPASLAVVDETLAGGLDSTASLKVWKVLQSLETEPTATFVFDNYANVGALVDAINSSSLDVVATLDSGVVGTDAISLPAVAKTALVGGDDQEDMLLGAYDGDASTDYRACLEKAYNLLIDLQCDIVVPLGVSFGVGNKTDSLRLAEFCFESGQRDNDVMGMINTETISDISLAGIQTAVAAFSTADNVHTVLTGDGTVDLGRYISIVLGPDILVGDAIKGDYYTAPAAAYAGLLSKLAPQSGTTNKTVTTAKGLRFMFSPAQIAALNANKLITLRAKSGRGVVVVEGLLASLAGSDFQSIASVRTIFEVMKRVRSAADPFIGEPLDATHVDALKNAISTVLNGAIDAAVINGGDFEVYFGGVNAIIGDVNIELQLDIPSEIRRIICTVSRRIANL